mmetsp:Transcript_5464/g.12454  ORF Transcript_5464/g.12454 Transcript_5464/m.12454 type:complete len:206 (-) Transcript_5464:2652-3269(-)
MSLRIAFLISLESRLMMLVMPQQRPVMVVTRAVLQVYRGIRKDLPILIFRPVSITTTLITTTTHPPWCCRRRLLRWIGRYHRLLRRDHRAHLRQAAAFSGRIMLILTPVSSSLLHNNTQYRPLQYHQGIIIALQRRENSPRCESLLMQTPCARHSLRKLLATAGVIISVLPASIIRIFSALAREIRVIKSLFILHLLQMTATSSM